MALGRRPTASGVGTELERLPRRPLMLIGGGLLALQSAAVASGALFAVVLLVAIYSMRRAFGEELEIIQLEEELAETEDVAAEAEGVVS